jgi:hypothetical protein
MKKLILIALAFAGLNAMATQSIGIKPVVNDPKCNGGNTGSITLTVSGGTTPYSYQWTNGLPNSATQSGLIAGEYTVTVTDHLGVTSAYTVGIGQPSAIDLTTDAQNVSAHGAADGCIHMEVAGGTPDYNYHWSNNANIESPCGLTAGTYYVTVTDAFGCTTTGEKTIEQPAESVHIGGGNGVGESGSLNPNTGQSTNATLRSDNVTTGNTTEATNVTVYPNPASTTLTINVNSTTASEITLYNTLGQVILTRVADATETKLDVSNLPKGNYIASVRNEAGTTNKMVVIIK